MAGHGLSTLATMSSVSSTQIDDFTIANPEIASNAAIATSKISGSLQSIAGHGLGALATMNAVSSARIDLNTIVDNNIATNAAIVDSKLATLTTPGKISSSAITSGTIGSNSAFTGALVDVAGPVKARGSLVVNGSDTVASDLQLRDHSNSRGFQAVHNLIFQYINL